MARGEEWNTEAHIGRYEASEKIRVYSSVELTDNSAVAVAAAIYELVGVESVRPIAEGPRMSFEVTISDSREWEWIEGCVYDFITMALEGQKF